jgi:S-adenosylmethionine:tRNA ribosyltransferase-isomerase
MIAAASTPRRPEDRRLLVVGAQGRIRHAAASALIDRVRAGDLVVANDAATLPASLAGLHAPSGAAIEVRLAGRRSLDVASVGRFDAIVFGAGDFRTRTEERPLPPPLHDGDHLELGPLRATVLRRLGHPRLVEIAFSGTPEAIWAGIARHGRPIQYAHVRDPLALWDVWTPVAALPVAFEAPSAGFILTWRLLADFAARGVGFATLTHAAGISSTGDHALDRRLPFDEPYFIPGATAAAIAATRAAGGRVIAIGTTVVRALESAARGSAAVAAGHGLARGRIGPDTRLRVVDVLVSGVHERGTSHFELLRALAGEATLDRAAAALEVGGYQGHEFGDAVWLEARAAPAGAYSEGYKAPSLWV